MGAGLLNRLNSVSILVVGDLILDTYTVGKVKRISPEAPVGVVHVDSEEAKPGGACNVALNIEALGSKVQLVGRVGDDASGARLVESITQNGIDTSTIVRETDFITPHKNRVIAENQQLVRIDHEKASPLSATAEQKLIADLPQLLEGKGAVAVSDYGKGFLTPNLLKALINEANNRSIPVIVDPKGSDFSRYNGATMIKPNQAEAYAASKLSGDASLEQVAQTIQEGCSITTLMITRSKEGIALFDAQGQRSDYPVSVREVKDVTGAGDTVLAMVACALANGLTAGDAAILANAAAGIAIEYVGCARVTLSQLAHKLLTDNVDNKVFDEEHLYALQQVIGDSNYVIIGFDPAEGLHPKAYRAMTELRLQGHATLLYLNRTDDDSLHLLAALRDVDFILRKGESLASLHEAMSPSKLFVATQIGLIEVNALDELFTQLV